jgi:hypothetical protein
VDVVTQKAQATAGDVAGNAPGASTSNNGSGVDAGVKLGVGGFEGVLYGYTGKGIGTTGLYILPTSASGEKRKSDGGYAQASYKFDKLKVGVSYGVSNLKLASDEEAGAASTLLLKRNESVVGGLYYSLTKSVTLVGEFMDTKAKAWNGNSAKETTYALGGIIFF